MKQLTQVVMDDAIRARYLEDLDNGDAAVPVDKATNAPPVNPVVPSQRWIQRVVRM